VELNKVFADGIVNGRQASPLLEVVTKVEAAVALLAGAAAAVTAPEGVDGVDGVAVVPADVVAAVVALVVAFGEAVVSAELSEPQPLRIAKKETQTNPAHTFSAPIFKTIVTCPIAA
jgi:hypothetical protein